MKSTLKKVIMLAVLSVAGIFNVCLQAHEGDEGYIPSPENIKARQEFNNQRFGIFLHWGIYSMYAQNEWYLQQGGLLAKEYAKAAGGFYPSQFDAKQWVDIFKRAGAKYVTITTRHHDGFSMFDTKYSDYNIMNTPFKRDIIKELSDACHAEGLSMHFYYSHLDWTRTDYPIGETGHHTRPDATPQGDYNSYFNFMNSQLTELLTNYGRIGAIWFDGLWDHKTDLNWRLGEQYALIHKLQPACMIGNNHHLEPLAGEDFQLFERDVPGENTAGLSGQSIGKLPLETCQTMNSSWGYTIKDLNYKSVKELIHLLVRTSAKGANLLLNVGPQPNGNLPNMAIERLLKMGEWLKINGESIYGTTAGPVKEGYDIQSTRKGNKVYVHILKPTLRKASFNLPNTIEKATTIDGKDVNFTQQEEKVELFLPKTEEKNRSDNRTSIKRKRIKYKNRRCYY